MTDKSPLCGFCLAPDPHWAFPVLQWKVEPDHLIKLAGKTSLPMCDYCSDLVQEGKLTELAEFAARVLCATHGIDYGKEADKKLARNLATRSISAILETRCGPIEKF